MTNWKILSLPIVLSLASGGLGACANRGQTPEPQTASNAPEQPTTATPMQTSPQVAQPSDQPTWEGPPGPGPGATPPRLEGMQGMQGMESAQGTQGTAAPVALTDEQIVAITDTVNEAEIEQAKLAQKKAQHPRVKKFAANMATHHSKAKRQGQSMAEKADLTMAESPVARDLKGKTSQQTEILKSAEQTDFDRTYTEGQIEQHQAVLDLLNNQLIPNASDPALRTELENTRDMIQSHLMEAREIRRALMAAQTPAAEGDATGFDTNP